MNSEDNREIKKDGNATGIDNDAVFNRDQNSIQIIKLKLGFRNLTIMKFFKHLQRISIKNEFSMYH